MKRPCGRTVWLDVETEARMGVVCARKEGHKGKHREIITGSEIDEPDTPVTWKVKVTWR